DDALDRLFAGEQGGAITAGSLVEVEVQVAIAHVTVGHQAPIGHVVGEPARGTLDELGYRGDRHRNVVLEAAAIQTLGFGNGLAQLPESRPIACAARHCRIRHQAFRQRAGEALLEEVLERIGGAGGGELAEQVPRMRYLERVANTRYMPRREIHRDPRDQLEGADTVAARLAQTGEQAHGGAWVGNCNERGREGLRLRKELQTGGSDDAESALGTEEERFDVVTRVVFAERPERGEEAPVRERHLEAEHEVAHHAV